MLWMGYDNDKEQSRTRCTKKTPKIEHNKQGQTCKNYEVSMHTSPSKQISYH